VIGRGATSEFKKGQWVEVNRRHRGGLEVKTLFKEIRKRVRDKKKKLMFVGGGWGLSW